MATTYVTLDNLKKYDTNLKTYIDSENTKSIKGYLKKDNTWNFYNTDVPTEDNTPIFSIDVPTEYFLDQTKTTFVQEFAWSEDLYAGSTNPELEGKPVWVMAVKGDDDTVAYSFINLESLAGDASAKADKLVNPEDGEAIIKTGQIFIDDGNGNLSASGITIEELKTNVSDEVMSNFDTETDVDSEIDSWF